ncbi:hypothetical protein FIA58_014680 [Flavobacterium jejuense]|uniref:Spi protease inhibitor domain-containing protein n=1 Tax=Flavobacterium jejuense TaxID=1544455 RepID=A0ABX0IT21_9FLAO|nr:hypothetical protein [Flavobacterium jejuense]NHN26927.1 hypothetical protein [Flavobacterium jejuense]
MKHIFIYFMFFFSITSKSQVVDKLTFDTLKIELINFLSSKKDTNKSSIERLKNNESEFNLRGLFNNRREGELINGLYSFSIFGSHTKGYFVIVENNSYTILDLSTREGLDKSIKDVLDFSERSKYCVSISSDIVSRLITVYYNINKYPLAGIDLNCERGVSTTDDLP